jgi:toxin YoeB
MKPTKRDAVFHPEFRSDLEYWVKTERKIALQIFKLIEAVMRDPFTGIGQPEPLKYLEPNTLVETYHSRTPSSLLGK